VAVSRGSKQLQGAGMGGCKEEKEKEKEMPASSIDFC